jgi:prevent-host-death family protein
MAGTMDDVVNVHEAKTHLSRLLQRVEAGEEIVIARGGTPIARIVPMPAPRKWPGPGLLKGKAWAAEDAWDPDPELEAAWEAEEDWMLPVKDDGDPT